MLDWFIRLSLVATVNLFFAAALVLLFRWMGFGAGHAAQFGQMVAIPALMLGLSGAAISVFFSKDLWMLGRKVRMIHPDDGEEESWLWHEIYDLTAKVGVPMPQVCVYEDGPNAMCIGALQGRLLFAVSTGLLDGFPKEEIRGILAHETGHAAHMDGATLALLSGTIRVFTIAIGRFFGGAVDLALKMACGILKREPPQGWPVTHLVESVVGAVAMLGYFAVSRHREFAADARGAALVGSPLPLMHALNRLAEHVGEPVPTLMPNADEAYGTVAASKARFALFDTHPSLDSRVGALLDLVPPEAKVEDGKDGGGQG